MNKSYLIALAVAVVIIAAIGFVLTAGDSETVVPDQRQANATSTATTTMTASANVSTTSRAAAQVASVAVSSRPSAAPAARPSEPSGESVTVTGRACTANDLTGSASWARSGGSVTGLLTVTNSPRSDCVLSRFSDMQVMSGNRVLDVAVGSRPSESVLLREGRSAGVWFRWDNWCGSEPSAPYEVRFVLPGGDGYLEVPVIDPSGRPSSGAPLCEARAYPSTVSVWW